MKKKIDRSFVYMVAIILLIVAISLNLALIFAPYIKDGLTKISCKAGEKVFVETKTIGEAFCK